MNFTAWQPNGGTKNFTADTTPPTSQQMAPLSGVNPQTVKVDNTSTTVSVVVGWGASDDEAKANAANGVQKCCLILPNSTLYIIMPGNAYVTGKTGASTAVIYVQPGVT